MLYDVQCGRMEDRLPLMRPNLYHSCVTDPPYELGFMGKSWDSTGVAFRPETWRHVLRVLRPGAHLLAFCGSRTYHRVVCAIEDAGFEVRDQLLWIYGSGFPKSLNLDEKWQGWGTALKPAHEPVVLARKPLDGTVAQNVLRWGVGALNIDGCRVPSERATGWAGGAAGGNTWNESNSGLCKPGEARPVQGRWPANLIHDGSDEVVALFPGEAGAAAPVRRRNADKFRNTYGAFAGDVDEEGSTYQGDSGSASRFFYCAKASRADRDEGLEGFEIQAAGETSGRHDGSLGSITMRRNTHETVKPVDLMRYLCRLVTPPGGIVLDPFFGSGSTGKAALLEGFSVVGVTDEERHAAIARARCARAAGDI